MESRTPGGTGPAGRQAPCSAGIRAWGGGHVGEEGEPCLSSPPSPPVPPPRSSHDSCDIVVVQSTVCKSSKLKITFIKCLVTQDAGACLSRGARACTGSGGR